MYIFNRRKVGAKLFIKGGTAEYITEGSKIPFNEIKFKIRRKKGRIIIVYNIKGGKENINRIL